MRQFICACGRKAFSKFPDIDKCQKCRKKPTNKVNCKSCGSPFYSSIGKELCKKCIPGDKSASDKIRLQRLYKKSCDDVKNWKEEINVLWTKLKYDLIEPLDIYRIANVYMTVICNEWRYSSHSPEEQCKYMMHDLWQLLNFELNKELEEKDTKKRKKNFNI